MSLNEYADRIGVWVYRHFPAETVERRALALAEETGEVVRCVLKMSTGARGTSEEWRQNLIEEIGDTFITLQALAGLAGIDLDDAVRTRWATVEALDPRARRITRPIA